MLPDVANAMPPELPPEIVYQAAPVAATPPSLPPIPQVSADSKGFALPPLPPIPVQRDVMASAQTIVLPARIPAQCVADSAQTYGLNPMVLLAMLKAESDGKTGIVSKNTDGSFDLGPAQFNTYYWAKTLIEQYGIPREALINDMCQSIHAMAFAVRTEINQAGGDMWKGIGNYHSRTPSKHTIYVSRIREANLLMVEKGAF